MFNSAEFKFSRRRIRNVSLAAASLAVVGWIVHGQNTALQHSSFTTGYLLIGSVFFLAAFNLRKKLACLPALGSAAFWMQLHIYVGLATIILFGAHIAWRIPDGGLEMLLASLYVLVSGSGVYGLFATRVFPKRLRGLGEEVIFENIPSMRQRIAAEVRSLVLHASSASDVLGKLYVNRLVYFFERPRPLAYLLYPSGKTRRQLIGEIDELDRFLNEDQRGVSRQISGLVKRRDDLDYHHAIQGRLKIWLFVHVGLTYSLLLVAVLHLVLVHSFHGGQ